MSSFSSGWRVATLAFACLAASTVFGKAQQPRPVLHLAANGNFAANGEFLPGKVGFDLADVSNRGQLDRLPDGVKGLVWMGLCAGADKIFVEFARTVIDHPKLFGFYLMDDPDPTGGWRPSCKASDLRAESDWIHARRRDAMTFVALMNLGSWAAPDYGGEYAPEKSHVDLFGVSPYPCRANWPQCDYGMIDRFVAAAARAGIPLARVVPIYQAFGGGGWRADSAGQFRLPSPTEMEVMFERWRQLTPAPVFDYVYSWGVQKGDDSLIGSAPLQEVFAAHNRSSSEPDVPQ
jgi:hypothetical protein